MDPLTCGHVLFQDILVDVHAIDLDDITLRWTSLVWRIYDFLLLTSAYAHGVSGLCQMLKDFKSKDSSTWALFAFWLALSLIGAVAIIGGVRTP